ncbi:MAG: protease modulator HflK, partial [Methylophilales bacterium 16-45-9]
EGPPDLDEVMRDLSRKINTLFGKGGGNQSNPQSGRSQPSNVNLPIVPILGVIALVWLATGFYIVDQGSLGVVQRFGKVADETTEPGPRWHLPYPIETVQVVNMEQVRRLEVGYRSSGEGSGGKTKVPKEAFEDVNRANQDNQRQINEGQAYANDVIPKARGTASRLLAEAAGYKLKVESEARGNVSRFDQILAQYNNAPEVTRQRLYLDAQEQIMSSVSKVIVDQKSGNSLLYLPLDKLINATGADTVQQSQSMQSLNPQPEVAPAQPNAVERSRDAFRSRDRESR